MERERLRKALAFAAIYFIWGSTYLAIRFAIETIPPFLMIGLRSFLAGAILYGWARWRGASPPTARQWGWAAVVGILLFAGGQGMLAYAMMSVPSGASALVIATIPLWMTLLQALREDRSVLGPRVVAGLALGFGGVFLLVEPGRLLGGTPLPVAGTAILLWAALSWSVGSVIGRHAGHRGKLPASVTMTTGMTLLAGSALLVAGSVAGGEAPGILHQPVSLRSLLGIIYLLLFGSVVAFGAYTWLMRVSTPSRVSTYAFVNPVVAVLNGWLLGNEELSPRLGLATALLAGAVALIITAGGRARAGAGGKADTEPESTPAGETVGAGAPAPALPALEPCRARSLGPGETR